MDVQAINWQLFYFWRPLLIFDFFLSLFLSSFHYNWSDVLYSFVNKTNIPVSVTESLITWTTKALVAYINNNNNNNPFLIRKYSTFINQAVNATFS